METLTGEFKNVVDDKGRVSLPARLRAGLPGSILVLTQGMDHCLWLFLPEVWESFRAKIMQNTSPFNGESRLLQRRIVAPAQEVEIDKAGRIAIPQSLREYAGLTRECVVLGIDKYVEIWDQDQYKTYWDTNEAEFLAAAEKLQSISF